MCKTNMKMNIYFVNICKHEQGKNMTRLWCKIVLKIHVEQTKGNERSYFYYTPLGLNSKKLPRSLLCVHQ
jgi:hypothetical protein